MHKDLYFIYYIFNIAGQGQRCCIMWWIYWSYFERLPLYSSSFESFQYIPHTSSFTVLQGEHPLICRESRNTRVGKSTHKTDLHGIEAAIRGTHTCTSAPPYEHASASERGDHQIKHKQRRCSISTSIDTIKVRTYRYRLEISPTKWPDFALSTTHSEEDMYEQ